MKPKFVIRPNHAFSLRGPARVAAPITTLSQISDLLLAPGIYQTNFIRPALWLVHRDQEPFSVWRPIKPLVPVFVGIIIFARTNEPGLVALQIQNFESGPVLQIGDFF